MPNPFLDNLVTLNRDVYNGGTPQFPAIDASNLNGNATELTAGRATGDEFGNDISETYLPTNGDGSQLSGNATNLQSGGCTFSDGTSVESNGGGIITIGDPNDEFNGGVFSLDTSGEILDCSGLEVIVNSLADASGLQILDSAGNFYNASGTVVLTRSGIFSGTEDASVVTSGTMATARLGSGTASSSTFLRGDQTWATASPLAGSSSIVTVGTVTTGTWSATTIAPNKGGTGVANNASSTLTISGAFATTLTVTGATSVTLPTSGTLLTTVTGVTVGGAGSTIHGVANATGAATTAFVVTIGQTLANTTYGVSVAPLNALSAAAWYISAQTQTTFTVTYLAALTGAVSFTWTLAL